MRNCYILSVFTLLALLCLRIPALSQATHSIVWQKTIGGSDLDGANSIYPTSDGGYILGGSSRSDISGDKTQNSRGTDDYWVIKIDGAGAIQWQQTIGGSDSDVLLDIKQTMDGGYILGGTSYSGISGDKTESTYGTGYWAVKLSNTGIIEWQQDMSVALGYADFFSLAVSRDGGYLFGGWTNSDMSGDKSANSKGAFDMWIVKLSSTGTIVWDKTIGGASGEGVTSMDTTWDGGYILGGQSNSGISGDKTEAVYGSFDYWIVKIDSIGNVQWDKTIGGAGSDAISDLICTSDSGFFIAGHSSSSISGLKTEGSRGANDYWVLKLDSIGTILWQKTIGGPAGDGLTAVAVAPDGGYLIGGYSESNIGGDKSENSNGASDYWIVKIDNSGNFMWDKTLGGQGTDFLFDLVALGDGFVAAGRSNSDISGDKSENSKGSDDMWVISMKTVLSNSTILESTISLSTYPNPVTANTHIRIGDFPTSGQIGLEVISIDGKSMYSDSGSISSINSSLGSELMKLSQGTYLLKVSTPEGVGVLKLIR